jgi:UDP-glucose 4-epimerase
MIRDLNLSSRLIFTSSASSFNSSSPYLASKQSCESICKAYKESFGIDTRILKLSNVYGPFSVHKHSVIPKFIKSCLLFKPLQIFGDGTQQRDFVHVRDVISSIINGQEGFITSGIGTRIIDLAEMISSISDKLLNYRPKIVFENSISGEVKVPRFLSSITPSINLEDGLLSTFKWFKENYETKLLVNA